MPPPELLEQMGAFNQQLMDAGILVDGGRPEAERQGRARRLFRPGSLGDQGPVSAMSTISSPATGSGRSTTSTRRSTGSSAAPIPCPAHRSSKSASFMRWKISLTNRCERAVAGLATNCLSMKDNIASCLNVAVLPNIARSAVDKFLRLLSSQRQRIALSDLSDMPSASKARALKTAPDDKSKNSDHRCIRQPERGRRQKHARAPARGRRDPSRAQDPARRLRSRSIDLCRMGRAAACAPASSRRSTRARSRA